MSAELTTRSLVECEAVIERGLATFVEVGEALLEIRDGRLYRDSHGTFEDYCQERWDFSRQRAHQLTQAAEVSTIVGSDLPNEGVARELAPLRDAPEQVREVWSEATELHGERPTAAQVREVVETHKSRPHSEGSEQSSPAGSRALAQQGRVVAGITDKAARIAELAPHLDLAVVRQLPEEERDQWRQQLSPVRAALGRLIAAL